MYRSFFGIKIFDSQLSVPDLCSIKPVVFMYFWHQSMLK